MSLWQKNCKANRMKIDSRREKNNRQPSLVAFASWITNWTANEITYDRLPRHLSETLQLSPIWSSVDSVDKNNCDPFRMKTGGGWVEVVRRVLVFSLTVGVDRRFSVSLKQEEEDNGHKFYLLYKSKVTQIFLFFSFCSVQTDNPVPVSFHFTESQTIPSSSS